MSGDTEPKPEAQIDPEPERAPGGADAVETAQHDPGTGADGSPVTPDEPLSAQQDEDAIPDEIQEGERPEPAEQQTDNTDEPSS